MATEDENTLLVRYSQGRSSQEQQQYCSLCLDCRCGPKHNKRETVIDSSLLTLQFSAGNRLVTSNNLSIILN